MKNVEQQNIKKYCSFYVSDLHLSVMLMPYINREINEDVEVTTIFEEIERKNFNQVIEKMNIANKEKFLNINWYNKENLNEKEIKKILGSNKNITIIIGGSKNYIKEINEEIINYIKSTQNINKTIKIIDCYNVEEIGTEMEVIAQEYEEVLNTAKCYTM